MREANLALSDTAQRSLTLILALSEGIVCLAAAEPVGSSGNEPAGQWTPYLDARVSAWPSICLVCCSRPTTRSNNPFSRSWASRSPNSAPKY